MDSADRFGLEATFSFTVAPSTSKSIKSVLSDLDALQNAIKGFSSGKGGGHIPDPFAPHKGGGAKQQINDLKNIKAEFRALRAESRNIDFGDLNDPNTFNQAKKGLQGYIKELETLKSTIKGNSAAEREFKAQLDAQQRVAGNKIDIAGNQRTAAQSQQKMGIAGTVAATGASALLPLVSVGKEAISIVRGFDAQIAQARAVSGASAEESLQIRNKAKELGAATKFSASEAAGAFVLLGQAGFNAEKQLKAIDGTLMLAAAGAVDLATATDITVSTLGGFQAGADKASHYANVLAQTANAANLGVTDLGETMKYTAPSAKSFGASVEQTAAMAGVLANAGIKSSQAGTSLRAMFDRLGDPVGKAAQQLKQYGIQVTDASGSFREMPDILTDIQSKIGGLDDKKQSAFFKRVFGINAAGAVKVLVADLEGLENLTQKNLISSKAFGGIGVAAHQAEIMGDNIDGAFVSMGSAIEGVFIDIADVLKIAVVPIVKKITELARSFTQLPKPIKTAIVVTGGIVAGLASLAAIAGSVAFGFYALQGAMATAAIGMTTMASAGIPLTGFFGTVMSAFAGQGIVGGFTAFGSVLTGTVATALGALVSPFAIVTGALVGLYAVLEYITPGVNILGTALSAIAVPVGFVTGLVKGFATTLFSGLGERLGGLGSSLGSLSPILGFLGDTVKMVSDTFSKFFGMGESSGAGFANSILLMVDIVGGAFKVLWGAIDLFLIKPINLARDTWGASFTTIGQIVGFGVSTVQTMLSPLLDIPNFFRGIVDGINSFVSAIPQIISDPFGFAVGLVQNALTSFTALPQYFQGIITQIQSTVSAVTGFITAPFQAATSTINTLWDNTGGRIAGVFNMLTGKSAETGYDLVGNLAEHSPGTTWQIRQKWGMTTEAIAGGLDKLVGFGEDTGKALSESMSLPKLGEVAMPTMGAMGAIALPAIANAIPLEIQPVIDQTGIIDQTSSGLNTGLAQIPVDGMLQSFSQLAPVEFLVDKLALGFSAIDTSLKSATGSSVFFGMAGIASISPLLIGVGALGLTIAAVSLNFLGLRDIIVGVGKSIWSILDAAKNVALGIVQVFQGVIGFIGSIPSAILGDFSGMAISLQAVWNGMTNIATGFANGVVGVFGGLGQSIKGIFVGIEQVFHLVFLGGFYDSIVSGVNNGILAIRNFGVNLVSIVSTVGQNVGLVFDSIFSGEAIAGSLRFIQGNINNFGVGVATFFDGLGLNVRTSFSEMMTGWYNSLVGIINKARAAISSLTDTISSALNKPAQAISNTTEKVKGIFGFGKNKQTTPAVTSPEQIPTVEPPTAIPSILPLMAQAQVIQSSPTSLPTMPLIGGEAPITQRVMPQLMDIGTASQIPTTPLQQKSVINSPNEIAPPQIQSPTLPQMPVVEQQISIKTTGADAAISQINNVKVGTTQLADSTGNAVSSLGQMLGFVSPALAAPVTAIGGFISTGASLGQSIGQLKEGIGQFLPQISSIGSAFTGTFPAIASFGGSILSTVLPALASVGTAVLGLIPGFGGMATGMTGAAIAGGGLTASLAPLLAGFLPIIAGVGAIAGALFLLKTAFENNFLGFRDLVGLAIAPFINAFNFVKSAVGSAIDFIQSKFNAASDFIKGTIGKAIAPLIRAFESAKQSIVSSFAPIFEALRVFSPVLNFIGNAIMSQLAIPFKVAGGIIFGVIAGIANILSPVISLVGTLGSAFLNGVLAPVRLVASAVGAVQSVVNGIGATFANIPTMLGGIFTNLWNLIPTPIRWLVENAMGGAAIGGAINTETPTIPQFATGGLMQNEGLAYLHPNEFIVNPQATEGNIGALSQLNSTGTLPTAMMATPIPVPTAPPQTVAQSNNQSSSPANVTVSLSFGDVIIQNATDGVQAAKEFFENVKPQFDRAVRDSLREMTELAK